MGGESRGYAIPKFLSISNFFLAFLLLWSGQKRGEMSVQKKGNQPDFPLSEFAMWFETPGEQYEPYPVTLETLSTMAGISYTTARQWSLARGFPKRDANGLIDARAVWKWKTDRDAKLRRGRRMVRR